MEMTVVKEFTFDAAHFLPNYKGLCSNLHGHTFRLQIGVKGVPDKETGMVIDYNGLKEIAQENLSGMDHACLNEVEMKGFPTYMPTSENIVEWIVNELEPELLKIGNRLDLVRLWETPTSYCEWRR